MKIFEELQARGLIAQVTNNDEIRDLINPLTDYLNKYENIFDENMYKSELQSYAKQTFFASYAMKEEDDKNPIGRNFTYEM